MLVFQFMIVQIIATIGPATGNKKILQEMIKNGMSLARLNFSWGTLEEHDFYIQLIRKVARELKKKIPIIQDLSGPRIAKNDKHSFDSGDKSILTRKDLLDLDFGVKHDVDYVAQSFVGDASDVTRLRSEMKVRNFNKPIIAKIERKRALSNLEEIIKASDAIMIGRGDLGNEIPLEQIPYAQETIIKRERSHPDSGRRIRYHMGGFAGNGRHHAFGGKRHRHVSVRSRENDEKNY